MWLTPSKPEALVKQKFLRYFDIHWYSGSASGILSCWRRLGGTVSMPKWFAGQQILSLATPWKSYDLYTGEGPVVRSVVKTYLFAYFPGRQTVFFDGSAKVTISPQLTGVHDAGGHHQYIFHCHVLLSTNWHLDLPQPEILYFRFDIMSAVGANNAMHHFQKILPVYPRLWSVSQLSMVGVFYCNYQIIKDVAHFPT